MRKLGLLVLLTALAGQAAVHRIHIEERTDVLGGAAFGKTGAYERITAKVHFRADPTSAANKIVRDIELAPRNDEGQVEWSADLYVLKPRDPAKGNGTVLFEVSNRGGKGMLSMFNFAEGSADPREPKHFGDKMLLEEGYTLVWLGWQWDVANKPGMMRTSIPEAKGATGLVRAQFVPDDMAARMWLADRDHTPYKVIDEATAVLTVATKFAGETKVIPRGQWRVKDGVEVELNGGFKPGLIYEFVYKSQDPAVAGLGMAGIRDLISFLKHGGEETLLADQSRFIKRAIGFGTSQSGRFLRTFLYDGFNADEKGRIVFDGLWPHVAGAGRGSFNVRFAQPSRDAQPYRNFFYPVDIFPFTDLDSTDGSATDGLLRRAVAAKVVPKIIYTNGSYEYWGRAASLIHTTPDGTKDAPLGEHQRVYFIAGAQHGAGAFPPSNRQTRNLSNPLDYRFVMRGLLAALHGWVKDNAAPPPSVYPRIAGGQLVRADKLPWPVKGIEPPKRALTGWHLNFETEPPTRGEPFVALVPKTNEYGNDLGGLRLPELHAPVGTYTGWNYPKQAAHSEAIAFIGTFAPMSKSALETMYLSPSRYTEQYRNAAESLISQRYLLPRDFDALMARAGKLWELATQ